MLKLHKIVAFDPSSTAVGWCKAAGKTLDAGFRFDVVGCGVFKPTRKLDGLGRIREIVDWAKIWSGFASSDEDDAEIHCVIEMSSGKVNRNRHGGGGAGLAMYGQAAGAMFAAAICVNIAPDVVAVTEAWTGGHSKDKRARVAKMLWPAYDPGSDKGGDISDAIALANWFFVRHILTRR